jgi:hypothetical protein
MFSHTTFAEPKAAKGAAPAAKTAEAKTAEALVMRELIQPLVARAGHQSKYSRARFPPEAQRVRVLDRQAHKDTAGRAFMSFAVDDERGLRVGGDDESQWNLATITGCVYLDQSEVFVKRGDEYRPAAFLLGKKLKAAAESTCQPEATRLAHAH